MDTRLPLLNRLWQQALRSFCSSDSSSSSKWVYAVFWRIVPRNYPPPRWDDGQGDLDRSSGNKRNWMLVWEDGFCDFYECERAGGAACDHQSFGPKIFFKMSHEVYNFGEGLIGKVAGENSHKWVHRESSLDADPNFFSSWNGYLDLYPKAWELQFNSGIQTIALVAVREGVIQLGSLDKVAEDLNVVICIQRKFLSLQCIPGVFAMQRPYPAPSLHYTNELRHSLQAGEMLKCGTRLYLDKEEESTNKSINLGSNIPRNNCVLWSNCPLLPSMSCNLGMFLSRLPCVSPPINHVRALNLLESDRFHEQNFFGSYDQSTDVKPRIFELAEDKPKLISPYSDHPCDENELMHPEFQMQGEEIQGM